MTKISFFAVEELPLILLPNSFYIKDNGTRAEMYITDKFGIRKLLGNTEMISDVVQQAISQVSGGLSAYQIALQNGFVGTQAQWLASLQGANGTSGSSGGSFTFIQSVPSATWIIYHGLGYRPGGIIITDSSNRTILGDIVYDPVDLNLVTISFASAFSGYAELS